MNVSLPVVPCSIVSSAWQMTVRFLFLFLQIEIELGLSDHDVAGYRYLKLIQDMNFETSFTLVSFRGMWWGNYEGNGT